MHSCLIENNSFYMVDNFDYNHKDEFNSSTPLSTSILCLRCYNIEGGEINLTHERLPREFKRKMKKGEMLIYDSYINCNISPFMLTGNATEGSVDFVTITAYN